VPAAAGVAAAGAAGRAAGAPGVAGLGAPAAGRGAPPTPAAGAVRGAAPGRAPASVLTSFFVAGNASRSLRTTGASMVEDGDLTNSPMSVSFAMISLLVLPSSFASSCTRALPATALLRDEGWRPVITARSPSSCVGCCSLLLHDVLTMGRPAFLSYWRLEDLPRVAEWSRTRRTPSDEGALGPCWCRVVRRPVGPYRRLDAAPRRANTPRRDAATPPFRGADAGDRERHTRPRRQRGTLR
jgi:hypothetical protein